MRSMSIPAIGGARQLLRLPLHELPILVGIGVHAYGGGVSGRF